MKNDFCSLTPQNTSKSLELRRREQGNFLSSLLHKEYYINIRKARPSYFFIARVELIQTFIVQLLIDCTRFGCVARVSQIKGFFFYVCCKLVFPQTRHILVQIEPSEPDLKPRTLLWDTPHLTPMNIQRSNPINIARYGRARHKAHELEELSCLQQRTPEPNQSFSPNLGSPSPPESPDSTHRVSCIGNYLLLEPLEGDRVFRAVHLHSGEELVCKVFDISRYQESLAAYFVLGAHQNINQIVEILLGDTRAYVFFERSHGDMHSFVRTCKKLREEEAARLFYQIASAVAHCHDNGLVLRDLKLRKFVFKNEERSLVKLESLEDTYLLKGSDDTLSDKHGCPAYVSPEILNASGSYSGKAADVWSLGVMLYTILVGRYPFHDVEPGSLFSKIRRGHFSIPETLTPKARCLIRSILRREPAERLTSREILEHPWFLAATSQAGTACTRGDREGDQTVPEANMEEELEQFLS